MAASSAVHRCSLSLPLKDSSPCASLKQCRQQGLRRNLQKNVAKANAAFNHEARQLFTCRDSSDSTPLLEQTHGYPSKKGSLLSKISSSLPRSSLQQLRRKPKRRSVCRAASDSNGTQSDGPDLPRTAEEQTALAQEAMKRAEADGVKRQRMQLLLPIDARASNFLDTEPRDYPCSMKEEYEIAVKQASRILRFDGAEIRTRRIGEKDQEMDPVGLVSTADKKVAAVVYPIAETLKQIQELARNSADATLLLVNAQWNDSGQVVSDFGFGPWKRKAEEFLGTFRPTFELVEQRIGEASNIASTQGGVLRLMRAYPHDWQVFLMSYDGNNECIATYGERPAYSELERLLQEVRKSRPAVLNALSTSAPPPPPLARSVAGPFTDEEIDGLDKAELRRALTALGLPTSGRLAVLQERVKEAQKVFES